MTAAKCRHAFPEEDTAPTTFCQSKRQPSPIRDIHRLPGIVTNPTLVL